MSSGDESKTSLTLLGRLRRTPGDAEVWDAFVERYGRKIFGWCRRWGLQETDAQDVTQNVLLDLVRQMSRFDYRPTGTFRGWLKTVAYRAWCDFLEARKRSRVGSGGDAILDGLSAQAVGDDLLQTLDAECEREMLEEAMAAVRLRVQPHTWQAFQLTAIDGLSGADVATQLGMQVGTVYVARGKVQKMLQEEIRRLEQSQ